ncbi:MAG: NnrS family protein [Pseudomonadota bacterium]|nr:NnrS family protein [Pseudomonadota bacterium]
MLKTLMSDGYRPMILCAMAWSAICMALWAMIVTGGVARPHPWLGIDWFVHEMVFGFGGAALASFMLVAIPNWAGHPIATGRGLVGLIFVWIAGRLAVFFAAELPASLVLLIDLGFLGFIAVRSAQLLIRGKAPHNLPLAVVAGLCAIANGSFHLGASNYGAAVHHPAARFGIALVVLMIALVGGRVLALFTRNWLNAKHHPKLTPFFDVLDAATLTFTAPALLLWAMHPENPISAIGLGIAGLLNTVRWIRWQRIMLWKEPLLISLQGAYLFVPIGLGLLAMSIIRPDFPTSAAIYAWLAGAMGLMPIAVLARIALTQAIHPIKGDSKDALGFAGIFVSAVLLTATSFAPTNVSLFSAAVIIWTVGYGTLLWRYVPVLARPLP